MSLSRAEELIEKLIRDQLSGTEWSEVLNDIDDESKMLAYSKVLEIYFESIVNGVNKMKID